MAASESTERAYIDKYLGRTTSDSYGLNVPHHLVGASEIARMLGVTRQRVNQLAAEPGFPAPEIVLDAGRIWSREAIIVWARLVGREVVERDDRH